MVKFFFFEGGVGNDFYPHLSVLTGYTHSFQDL